MDRMPAQHLAAGDCLFRQGDAGDRAYVLTQGSISIVGRHTGQRQRYISFSPGVMLGEMAMLDGGGRSADAVADTDAVVHALTRVQFDRLCASDPALGVHLLRNIARHLSDRLRAAA
jgi:glutaminase